MAPYYKDGYLEGVLFIFLEGDKALIEHRPKGGATETFIPNGKIEERDLTGGAEYPVVAMQREVSEEFGGQVVVKRWTALGEFYAEAVKIKFYGYLIDEWDGEVPASTVENGQKFADLEWIPLSAYRSYLSFDTALFFMEQAIALRGRRAAQT
jgi:8-oxo-dGTP pyrophosphatase MutT (NUDIX family)